MTRTIESAEWRVVNLDCEHDAAALKRGLASLAGVEDIDVYPKAAKVRVRFDSSITSAAQVRTHLDQAGFPTQETRELPTLPKPQRNAKVLTSAASGLLLLVGWLASLAPATEIAAAPLYAASILVGGYFFGREAIEELIFEREIGIELLMSVAAVVAAIMGQPAEGAMLVFLYSISEAAEGYTEEKTRSAIRALMALAPKVALVRRDGREVEIPVEELRVDDVFIARPGQAMPTDGEILSGTSSVNEAPVTGESVPVEKAPGGKVFAGTINGEAALEVRATRTHADNTLARIIQMVEEAQERRGRSQRFIERFGARYSPAVLGLGILAALGLPLVLGLSWQEAVMRATVFIVAAAPCALVISIPITMVAALGTAARNGVLVKGGVYVEELAKVSVVALDKTGTLTSGEPQVTDILLTAPSDGGPADEDALLAIAAAIERHSEHPLARAIVRRAREADLAIPEVSAFRALTGAGAEASVNGRRVFIGNPALFEDRLGIPLKNFKAEITQLQDDGKTVIVVGGERIAWGLLALRDTLRPNARRAVAALRAAGIRNVVMLTGDNPRTARAIAREVGIDEVFAELKPEDKVARVRALSEERGHVAMVGDGVNDAPALAEATVGVAMGAAGADVALETADVALMADDLDKLVYALGHAKRTQAVVRQNLALSAVVIGALIVGAVAGVFSLPIVVVAHEVSEFLVIASGLRMLSTQGRAWRRHPLLRLRDMKTVAEPIAERPYPMVQSRGAAWTAAAALAAISVAVIFVAYAPMFRTPKPQPVEVTKQMPPEQAAPAPSGAPGPREETAGGLETKSTAATVDDYVDKSLPNGSELHVPKSGVEATLLAFLESKTSSAEVAWFNLDGLAFETGKAKPSPSSREQLPNIAKILIAYPKVRAIIAGHTDNLGSAGGNRRLSKARAMFVLRDLRRMGVGASRLQVQGYGADHPVATNTTEVGRAKNRRISLGVIP